MTDKSAFINSIIDSPPIESSDFDELLELQSSILGVAARNDDCLELMNQLCLMAEKLTPESVASIMLYEKSEGRLRVRAAPSLSQEAIDALNGLQVGFGSCGNAVYHDEAMYVSNTRKDNRWCETISFAEAFNVSACWSVPFHNGKNEVIGTFALSSFEVREATNFQRKLLDTCAKIAGILLQKEMYLEQSALWEKETIKSEKLESIGVLAGGIAHDFNNLLSIVIGNLEMAGRAISVNSKAHLSLSSAEKAARRAAELTQQLLTFSKGGDPVKKLSDLREIVRDSAEFVLHGSGVALTFDCQCDEDEVLISAIDNGQISQVVQNLVINARQAMGNKGDIKITFSSASALSDDDKRKLKPGRYHKIQVQDSGPGVPAVDVDKIFDPYFTTKSEGSGLGLALSFSIIMKHDGYLYVETEEGIGSCFTIYLPASDENQKDVFGHIVDLEKAHSKGRILIMDDQEMLHEVAEEMLEELGFQTVHADDGIEAIEKYRQAKTGGEQIDLIIMDLTIPGGMGGKEAVQKILSLDADAKVIVCSGYSNDSVMSQYEEYGFKAALSKPYDLDELEKTISKALTA